MGFLPLWRGVTVTDLFPAGVTPRSFSGAGWTCDPIPVNPYTTPTAFTCTYGDTLTPGASATLTIETFLELTAPSLTSFKNYVQVTPHPDDVDETILLGTDNNGYETGVNSEGSNNDSSWETMTSDLGEEGEGEGETTTTTTLPETTTTTTLPETTTTTTTLPTTITTTTLPTTISTTTLPTTIIATTTRPSSIVAPTSTVATTTRPSSTVAPTVVKPGSLGDYVWFDTNSDGIQDSSEKGVEGVAVNLLDGNGNVVSTTKTDAAGGYIFENLAPGSYSVEFVSSTLPAGYVFTQAGKGTESTGSDANVVTGRTAPAVVTAGNHTPTLDAGIVAPTTPPVVLPVLPTPPVLEESAKPLAYTGSSSGRLLLVGGGLTLAGFVLLAAKRRKGDTES